MFIFPVNDFYRNTFQILEEDIYKAASVCIIINYDDIDIDIIRKIFIPTH